MGFQKTLNRDLPVGVEGDFASTNPYHTVLAGEGALKAGAGGVKIGVFGMGRSCNWSGHECSGCKRCSWLCST